MSERPAVPCPHCRTPLCVKRHTGAVRPAPGVLIGLHESKPRTVVLVCPRCGKTAEWSGHGIVITDL